MKKMSYMGLFCAAILTSGGAYADSANRLRTEVLEGLDIVSAKTNAYVVEDAAPGELGLEVYQTKNVVDTENLRIYIPTDMYLRGGAGLTLGFISDKAQINNTDVELSNSWATQIGLGWNLSSYVRTEIDFQENTFGFSKMSDLQATSQQLGGTLYFDFARRYVRTGDITSRRTFVPFMGLGVGVGSYAFEGAGGADGFFVAPRAVLGFNIMLTDVIGIDLSYQYQMLIGNGFGWDNQESNASGISNFMASFRVNF